MKGILLKYIVIFVLVIMSGGLLMDVSQRVQHVQRDIRHLDREIVREEENIRVLNAEWAYLNDPLRLEALVSAHLDLISPEAAQLISDMSVIPDSDSPSSIIVPSRSPLHRDIRYVPSSPLQANIPSNTQLPLSVNNNGDAR